ncbi:MAG: aminoacyl-tRNA hydrolase [Mycoplasmataceae bacterium]|nr:aminoacyl-tRNA hydrolase [Mycoplasmataceae bacterium]
MKCIVGLGNVGNQYEQTRHNLGFLIIEELKKRWNLTFKNKSLMSYATYFINGEKIIIIKPISFMNNSGQVINDAMNYFNLNIEDIIIFVDDKDQEMGNIKIVNRGGHGGQNGIRNTIDFLKTNNFIRVKGGIGSNPNIDTSSYVLGKWNVEQKIKLPKLIKIMANIAEDFINMDYIELSNKYNGK